MWSWISTWAAPPQYAAARLKSPRQIRLLELLPPSPDVGSTLDLIHAKLEVHSLDDVDRPNFTALSYVWGDASQTAQIILDGKSLTITKTLETTLRELRDDPSALLLWVDQICINQLDDSEKNQQIPLMRDIYTTAEKTIAWLGEPSPDRHVEEALDYLRRLGNALQSLGFTHLTEGVYTQLTADDDIEALGLVPVDDKTRAIKNGVAKILDAEPLWHKLDALDALDAFFSMPYFQRGWIKQEVALPSCLTVRCGKYCIDAETLYAGIQLHHLHWLHTLRRTRQQLRGPEEDPDMHVRKRLLASRPGFDDANATMNLRMRYHSKDWGLSVSLGAILRKLKSKPKFFDPKDRIYGVLGLASDAEALNIPVISSDGMTAEQVYATATRRIIHSGDVDFLLHAYRPEHDLSWMKRLVVPVANYLLALSSILPSWFRNLPPFAPLGLLLPAPPSNLPSWVPDFRNMSDQKLIADLPTSPRHPFAAGTACPLNFSEARKESADPNVLILKGIILDPVIVVGTLWSDELSEELTPLRAYLPLRSFRILAKMSRSLLEQNQSHPLWADEQQRARRMEAVWRVPIADHEGIGNALYNNQRATAERSKPGYEELYRAVEWGYRVMVNNESPDIIELDEDDKRELEGLEDDKLAVRRGELQAQKLQCGPLAANYLGHLGLFETRRGFLSLTGFVGFGPTKMQRGDLVCVVVGATVPVALRPLGNDRYLFVGEVYCDGVMDGEALQWGWEERTFHLC